jgi:hypothetical protein
MSLGTELWLEVLTAVSLRVTAFRAPWWWRQYGPLKRWLTRSSVHGAATHLQAFKLFWRIKRKRLVRNTKTPTRRVKWSCLYHVPNALRSPLSEAQIEPLRRAVNQTLALSCRPNGFIGVTKIFRQDAPLMAVLWCLPTVYDKSGAEGSKFYNVFFSTVSRSLASLYPCITMDVLLLTCNKHNLSKTFPTA